MTARQAHKNAPTHWTHTVIGGAISGAVRAVLAWALTRWTN
ncbi:hypothetical protein [Embleya sp. NPDC050493]